MGATSVTSSLRPAAETQLAAVAATQHGVFTRAQAIEAGMYPRTIARRSSKTWEPLYAGVYRVAGSPRTRKQALMAATMAWGPGAAISHLAAATLWAFAGLSVSTLELSVPRSRRRAHVHTVHRPVSLQRVDVTTHDGIPVTSVARTLIDIAACVQVETLEEALDDALRRHLVTMPRLRWRLRELGAAGRAGSGALAALIDARTRNTAIPQSVFETRLLRLLNKARLPMPALQHEVRTKHRRAFLDFAYVDEKIAIEAEGFAWHSSRAQWDNDRARGNALAILGWTVIRVTWTQLQRHPEEVVGAIRALLEEHSQIVAIESAPETARGSLR